MSSLNETETETINENVTYEFECWDELEIDTKLLRGIYSYGFEKPSPIQKKAILPLIKGKDLIAQAQSGTGKTATFTIGALANVNINENKTQVLVLSPTIELTIQTAKVFTSIGELMQGLKIQTLYGGIKLEDTNNFNNKHTPHVIVGCPGRVYDMIRREKISTKSIKLLILDEADEMLSSGFKDQVYNIFQYLNNDIQVALFTATLPTSVSPIIDKIMRNPVVINVNREALTLDGISQYYVPIDSDNEKYQTLQKLFSYLTVSQCIIYCNSIKRVNDLYEIMKEEGFPVSMVHSNMDKLIRTESFNEFKTGKSRVLISSDVTARGIDIQQVSIVINFDLPKCIHKYLHRIGRSGRWGRKGIGINFITRRDIPYMKEIETYYATQIMELPSDLKFLKNV
jgi:translation initiation factor 4A